MALDIGEKRIGVAVAGLAKLPRPLTTLENSPNIEVTLQQLIDQEKVGLLVVGRPRNLAGETTTQTKIIKTFAKRLETLKLPVHFQDETLTSAKAEQELRDRGKPYAKSDIDALAAVYILEDYLQARGDTV